MKKGVLAILFAMVVVGSFTAPAMASSIHIKSGPSFIDNGLTLTASGTLAGLGQTDFLVDLSATANPTATCTNPSGKQQPPGQNPAPITVTGSALISKQSIDTNGNAPFSVTTNPPVTPVPGAPDCPGSSWNETITDLSFTSATISVEQPAGSTPVVVGTWTFNPPTSNGPVPVGDISPTPKK